MTKKELASIFLLSNRTWVDYYFHFLFSMTQEMNLLLPNPERK